jgi:GGDEF domain-containing protein
VPANLVAGRICDNLARDGRKPKLSVSIGVAIYPRDGEKIDTLMGAADVAVHAMKARVRPNGNIPKRSFALGPKALAGVKTRAGNG